MVRYIYYTPIEAIPLIKHYAMQICQGHLMHGMTKNVFVLYPVTYIENMKPNCCIFT